MNKPAPELFLRFVFCIPARKHVADYGDPSEHYGNLNQLAGSSNLAPVTPGWGNLQTCQIN
jgi:hypothetical protein